VTGKRRLGRAFALIGSHAAAAALGALAAITVVKGALRSGFDETVALAYSSENARIQLRHGSPENARAALQQHLKLLASCRDRIPAYEVAGGELVTLMHLVDLEQRQGNPQLAADYLKQALDTCRVAQLSTCTEEKLRGLVAAGQKE